MNLVLKIYKLLIISVTLQLLFLIFMDNIYLTGKSYIIKTPFETPQTKDDRVSFPMNSQDLEVSYDSKYMCYRTKNEIHIMDIERRKIIKILGSDSQYISKYKWLPDKNTIIYTSREHNGNRSEVQAFTLDIESGAEKDLPKIKNLAYGSYIESIELAPVINIIYVKIEKKTGYSKVYKFDIMYNSEFIFDLAKGAIIKETAYSDKLLYENNNGVYVRYGNSKRKIKFPIRDKTRLIDIDSHDNVYIGKCNTKGEITSIIYGQVNDLLKKKMKTLILPEPIGLESIIITKEGRIFENVESEGYVKDLASFDEIKYNGVIIDIKKSSLDIKRDSLLSKDGNRLEIITLDD